MEHSAKVEDPNQQGTHSADLIWYCLHMFVPLKGCLLMLTENVKRDIFFALSPILIHYLVDFINS